MSKILIRKTLDHNAIAKLNESVQTLHHELYPNDFKKFSLELVSNFFKKALNAPNTYAFIAEIDSKPIGYLLCALKIREENEFQFEKKTVYIDQISVEKQYRRLGVAKTLIDEVFALQKELKASDVQLDHWAKNTYASDFFKHLGFEYFNLKMSR